LAGSTVVALSVLELAVRVLAPQALPPMRPDFWVAAETFGWRHPANLVTTIDNPDRTVTFMTDRDGHRIGAGETIHAPAWTVLALGDSFLEAYQVEAEETLTSIMARDLGARLGAPGRVVNSGVSGWDPNHYLLEARHRLLRGDIDLVAVFVFLGNDLVSQPVRRFPPRLPTVRRRLCLPATAEREEVLECLAQPLDELLRFRSHFYQLAKSAGRRSLAAVGLTRVLFPASVHRAFRDHPAWGVTADVLADVAAAGRAHGLPTVIVLLPSPIQVDPAIRRWVQSTSRLAAAIDLAQPGRLGEELARRGLEVVDLTPALVAAAARSGDELYGRRDPHLTEAGHREVAAAAGPTLFELLTATRVMPGVGASRAAAGSHPQPWWRR
jgi:hypothetical protein